ncbi:hypothetical protein [Pseudothermotoga sp.]|uniref:hypothetical protein n=1 Tax=Pseudothermotoga sp. TaxID=2033661 RepID=UPI000E95A47B|nr:hypothetical protein [Pseudothermotoga sp.]HBJ81688.1 hypothetical protein [Pseudothermotoga sp.]
MKRSLGCDHMIKVGISSMDLSFPKGLEMAGYILRKGVSAGYHDPLQLFCIYLNKNETEIAILIFDLLTVPKAFPKQIDCIRLIPVATHTHSGPKPSLVKDILESSAREALVKAKQNSANLNELIVKQSEISGICDFRNKQNSTKVPANLIEFKTVRQRFSITLFSCHPTVLGPENLLYSSDIAGAIRRKLQMKDGYPVVFLNSCCGDLSTHKTRKERSFAEIERLSDIFLEQYTPYVVYQTCVPERLSMKEIDFEVESVEKDIGGVSLNKRDLPGVMLLEQRGRLSKRERTTISFLMIDSLKFIFVPFELFFGFCNLVSSIAKFAFIVCYANSPASYVVPKNVKSGYEWLASPYADNTEDKLLSLISYELMCL